MQPQEIPVEFIILLRFITLFLTNFFLKNSKNCDLDKNNLFVIKILFEELTKKYKQTNFNYILKGDSKRKTLES